MFTKLTWKSVSAFQNNLDLWLVVPFKVTWDLENAQVRATKIPEKWRLFLWKLAVIYRILYVASAFNSLAEALNGQNTTRIVVDLMYSAISFAQGVFNLSLIARMQEIMEFIPVFVNTNTKLTESYFKTLHPLKRDGCDLILAFCVINTYICLLPFLGIFILNPRHPRYLYYWWLQNFPRLQQYPILDWVYAPVEYATTLGFAFSGQMIMSLILYVNLSKNFWLNYLHRHLTGAEARNLYNILRILTIMENNCLSDIAWPNVCFLLSFCLCVGQFGSLKMYGKIPLLAFGTFPVNLFFGSLMCFVMFPLAGGTELGSRKALLKWRHSLLETNCRSGSSSYSAKLQLARLKASPPFGVKVGSIFTIKKSSLLPLILVVSNLTINALLLH